QSLFDLHRLLHAAVALQLDAAVLLARRGLGAVLDRHRALHLQPRLQRRRLRRGLRPLRRRGPGDGARRLVVVRRRADQPLDQARHPAGDAPAAIVSSALTEDIAFLLSNRIPRSAATRFMGWFSRIENPLVARPALALWRAFADLRLEEAKK